jgi:hypothetical protein
MEPKAPVEAADSLKADCRDGRYREISHSFLPIVATVEVYQGKSRILVTSPVEYNLDLLITVDNRSYFVGLVPTLSGHSSGLTVIPAELDLEGPIRISALVRSGEEV